MYLKNRLCTFSAIKLVKISRGVIVTKRIYVSMFGIWHLFLVFSIIAEEAVVCGNKVERLVMIVNNRSLTAN